MTMEAGVRVDSDLDLVSPIPRSGQSSFAVNTKPKVREVVFVDNGKPNANAILKGAQDELRQRGIAVRDEILVRPLSKGPITDDPDVYAQLSTERGLVLDGV